MQNYDVTLQKLFDLFIDWFIHIMSCKAKQSELSIHDHIREVLICDILDCCILHMLSGEY